MYFDDLLLSCFSPIYLLFASPLRWLMNDTPPRIPFSIIKYRSGSLSKSNSIPVILSIASQLNCGRLK